MAEIRRKNVRLGRRMPVIFESWLKEVDAALASINMPLAEWQSRWIFDFSREFSAGTSANDAAAKAKKFWWHEQNKAIRSGLPEDPELLAAPESSGNLRAA
jgi:hypothetical protein